MSSMAYVRGATIGATAVAAGGRHTCALLTNARVACWGDDLRGQIGNGPTTGEVTVQTNVLRSSSHRRPNLT